MKHITLLSIALGVGCAVFLMSGCGRKPPEAAPEQKLPTASVRVQAVENLKRLATEEVVGTVRPRLSAALSAKISGTLAQMLVSPGQLVKTGQVLVEIDAREIQSRLDQAQAVREQAQRDLERFKKLLAQNAVTQQEFDGAQSRCRVADAAVAEAQTMLSYTRVTAPFDGLVTAKRADVGDLAAPGKPLIEMEDPTALRLEADVPEALLANLKLGDKLALHVPSARVSLDGLVSEISPAADPVSRTARVKLDLPGAQGLRSGQFGRVAVPVAEISAMRVPSTAVLVRGQMELAFVVVGGKAQMRFVKTGKHLGAEVEIVSGLRIGEPLVVEGAAQLLDGQPVEIKQ
ncbi:MAG: efflux RND transporter periplasmic adaptor subunit [Verrucomicrobia bacterium]|nr:efflux RND transporter periplasmic adaptor subunit [Verrucomicrobiota bacterium]